MEPDSLDSSFLAWRERSDLVALSRVFDELAPELYAVARHLSRGTSEAEDLVQQTFLVAIERAGSFDPARPLRPWLFGILALEARKLRARRAAGVLEEPPLDLREPPDDLAEGELRGAIARAVESLPPHYAQAVALHLEDGLAPREIAPRLSISSELARTHLSRGLAWLRRALPEGLTAGAWIASPRAAALRARVIEAARVPAAAAPAASALLVALLLFVPLTLVGGGVAWLLGAQRSSAAALALEASAARAASSAPGSVRESARIESDARGSARVDLTPTAQVAPPSATACRVRGSIRLATGASAAGALLRASSFWGGAPHELGSCACDAQGRFELAFEPPPSAFANVRVEDPGFVSGSSLVSDLAAGSSTDLGELVLPRAGSLRATLVDAEKRPLAEGWELSSNADQPSAHPANKRWTFWNRASVDARTGLCVLGGLPPGELVIVARTPLDFEQIRRKLTIIAGEETAAEFAYAGPDLARRVLVRTHPSWPRLAVFQPAAAGVRLQRAGESSARSAVAPARRAPGEYVFDDLPEGEYALEIDDARFERYVDAHVEPATALNVTLTGAASVHLDVRDAHGAALAKYGLRLAFPDANFRPNEFELWAQDAPAPREGLVHGLIPGHCTLTIQPEGLPSRSLDVRDLQRGETRELRVDYASAATLAGRVLDEHGAPLAGVALELTQGERAGEAAPALPTTRIVRGTALGPAPAISARGTSDAQGAFRFADLAPGRWTVRARFSHWLAADKTLALGPDTAPLELARPPAGFLAGRVLLPAGTDPSAVELLIGDDFVPRTARGGAAPDVTIARDGSFRAGPLPVGTFPVRALVPGSARSDAQAVESFGGFRDLGTVEIRAGAEATRDFDLAGELPLRLALEVRAGGVALESGWVVALRADGTLDEHPESLALGAGGRATLALSPARPARLAIVARELGWVARTDEVLSGASGAKLTRSIDVPLVRHTLRCVDAATRAPLPAHEIRWSAELAGLAATAHASTDAQGLLELALPIGQHAFADAARADAPATSLDWPASGAAPLELALRTRD